MSCRRCSTISLAIAVAFIEAAHGEDVAFDFQPDYVAISIRDELFARYVFRDAEIRRPYFADVRTLDGRRVTRTHPPVEGVDSTDHATMHPGIWLAFGDLDGADFWRNKGEVVHLGFLGRKRTGSDFGEFTVANRYVNGGKTVCVENCRISIRVRADRTYLLLDSTFTHDQHSELSDFVFGDQEEMGLGVRVATPMTVENGGQITNSDGLIDEAGCWGKQARWAEYSGMVDGERVGVVVMPHAENFGPSWFHARDYGLLVANPFGRNAFTGGEPSRVPVHRSGELRLRFGVCVYTGDPTGQAAYTRYLEMEEVPRGPRSIRIVSPD